MTKKEIIEILRWEPEKLKSAHATIKANREIVQAVVEWEPWAIQYADASLRDDEEMGIFVVENMPGAIQYLSERLQKKPSIIRACLNGPKGYALLKWVPKAYTQDFAFVLAVMKKVGRDLEFVSEELRGDKAIVSAAVENDPTRAIKFVHADLMKDQEFMEQLHQKSPEIFPFLPLASRTDRARALSAINHDGKFYGSLPSVLRADHAIIRLALERDPYAIKWVPVGELIEGEYWKQTIPKWPGTFFELPNDLQGRLDIVRLLVKTSEEYFHDLPEEVQAQLDLE